MKTDELIDALVKDVSSPKRSVASQIVGAVTLGGVVSVIVFLCILGVRPDLMAALETWRFVFKFVLCFISLSSAWLVCVELARPDARAQQVIGWIALAPTLLAAGVLYELISSPSVVWYGRTVGNYAAVCMIAIPLLSIAPLAAVLAALREGAPSMPTMSGAIAGLLSGSLAAMVYATHCPDDSPLFVGVWYSLAIGVVVLAGALVGRRLLRW